MSEEQAAYNVKPILDKQLLLAWIENEMESMGPLPAYSYRVGIYHGMKKVLTEIECGQFDYIGEDTKWKIKLRVEELLKEKVQEQLKQSVNLLEEIFQDGSAYFVIRRIGIFLSSLSQGTEDEDAKQRR